MKKSVNSTNYTLAATSCAVIIAITSIGASAWAGTRAFTVPANKTTEIWRQTAFSDGSCSSIDIRDYSLVQPKNGKLTVSKRRLRIPSGKCKGALMHSLFISYTPKPGFRGKDKGALKFRYQAHETSIHKNTSSTRFNITVK